MEGPRDLAGAPLTSAALPRRRVRYALEIPKRPVAAGCTTTRTPKSPGLDQVPPADRPPVTVVHLAFDTMVAIGFGLLGLGGLVR